jgi:hypothetical protein
MSDWATVSALATAAGTLVLAIATFASVRSANRAARTAERALLAGLKPVLFPSRPEDPPERVGFQDHRWVVVEGGHAAADLTDQAIYLVIAIRNVGSGIAVLDRWQVQPLEVPGPHEHGNPSTFRRLTRDIYVPAGDLGFWQGALREPEDPDFVAIRRCIEAREPITIELLYGDYEGGQRTITRFAMLPEDEGWVTSVSRHWNLDAADPR